MGRCILVLGTGESGTSGVAAILDALGVYMGSEFIPPRRDKPPTYENAEFFHVTRRILAGEGTPADYEPLIAANRERPIWGLKDPALVHTLPRLLPRIERAGDDVRFVVVRRDRERCINSFMRSELCGRKNAEKWYEQVGARLMLRLFERPDVPTLTIEFDDMVGDPQATAGRIQAFAFEGLPLPTARQFTAAIKRIRTRPPEKPQGWGTVAVGVRIAQRPEVPFFNAWTALMTRGLLKGDTVLAPQAHLPAHWASNALAKAFLKSGRDTLLMVDDDMTFSQDALHHLRHNQANWPYDVVTGLAMYRNPKKPKPVVMQLMEQPPLPLRLRGDFFDINGDFQDGEVVEVDALGLAFTLIRRRVLEAMINPDYGLEYTYNDWFTYGPGQESDDIPFSRRCRELGFRMAVDTSVKLGHCATVVLGYTDFLEWRGRGPSLNLTGEDLKPILALAADSGNARAKELLEQIDALAD